MGRWIAIGRAPGWDDIKQFSAELKDTNQWRIDQRTTITSVCALADGRLIAECHGPSVTEFKEWLRKKNLQVESLTAIQHVAKSGDIWKVN